MDLPSWNPCQVTEVSSSEYSSGDKARLREEGGLALYRNPSRQTWDCVLQCPETPAVALRLFQTASEKDAENWFLKLCPLLELARPKVNAKTLQKIMDCLKNHPDWSWAHIAVETGISGMNCKDGARQTALHLACEKGDLDCVRELLQEYGARTDVRNHNGDTPFHCAVKQGSAAIIQELCSHSSAGLNELNDDGEAPLHVACRFGKVELLKALLESGATCDVIGGNTGTIQGPDPAQQQIEDAYGGFASFWAKTPATAVMFREEAFRRETGESPLHISVKEGFLDSVIMLLSRGAEVNLRGLNGNTALHYAMQMDHMEMIKALIVFGANLQIPNDLGVTPELISERTSKELQDIVRVALYFKVETEPRTRAGEGDDSHAGSERMDRLLCLDGGGIRGLVLIEILMALEREAGRQVGKLFDWISGTSTGGILALGILHGKSLKDLRSLYFRLKDEIFTGSYPNDSGPLEKLLKEEFGEDTKMTKIKHPRVMVTSVLADRRPVELHLFRNYDPPALGRAPTYASTDTFEPVASPHEQNVWHAARATSAAPSYFEPTGPFQDGGLLANNPTLDTMTEIHHYNKALIAQGRESEVQHLRVVVSLGTGKPPQVEGVPAEVFWTYNPLMIPKMIREFEKFLCTLLDCCTGTDCCSVDRARAWCEQTNASYYRLSPQLSKEVKLDVTNNVVLVNILWETWKYLYKEKEHIQALAKQLVQD